MKGEQAKHIPEGFCKHGEATECVHCQNEAEKNEQKTAPVAETIGSFGKKAQKLPTQERKVAEAETIYVQT